MKVFYLKIKQKVSKILLTNSLQKSSSGPAHTQNMFQNPALICIMTLILELKTQFRTSKANNVIDYTRQPLL